MKICFFNSAKVWGGGEKWHLDHALAFSQDGHEVVVISNTNSELIKRASAVGLQTISYAISNFSFLNPFKLWAVYTCFRKEKFDIIVMNFSNDLKVAAPMAKLASVSKIVYRRGSDIPIKNTFLNRYLFGKCLTDILANSEATKQAILQNNPALFPKNKIKVIYNGVIIKPLSDLETVNEMPIVGALGRLVHQKGIDILLDIAAILKSRSVVCKFRIGGDGVLKNKLLQKTIAENLSDFVDFVGFVEDPHAFMRGIDVFVLPSRWEGFGYVLAEAMLAKKPLVAFDISSNPELVFHNINGFLIPFGEKEKFADAIQTLIEQPDKRKSFGAAGLAIVQEKFNFENNKKQVITYLSAN
jgi:glycosyltransferase involved in cell wall biosynthesis